MDNNQIKDFLIKSNRNGYGNNNVSPADEADGSHTIIFNDGNWKFHDNYFGGEPYGGREVISYHNKPVWIMVYYGWVNDISLISDIYTFLKESLLNFTEDMPYRGPSSFTKDNWEYINKVNGEFSNFSGEEIIYLGGKEMFRTKYSGGLINQ